MLVFLQQCWDCFTTWLDRPFLWQQSSLPSPPSSVGSITVLAIVRSFCQTDNMHSINILLTLLSAGSTTFSAPLDATIPRGTSSNLVPSSTLIYKRNVGSAHVINNCPFGVTLQPVRHGNANPAVHVAPNSTWAESFQPTTSVKIWTNDPSHPAQFEYDVEASKVWYDLSLINGNPFGDKYQALIPAQANCGQVQCLPNQHCDLAYNTPSENTATHGCPQSSDVMYYLCEGPKPQVVPDTFR